MSRKCNFTSGILAVAAGLLMICPVAAEETPRTRSQAAMEDIWGPMTDDGAEWRTPNPDFADAGTTPREFAIRWQWDRYRQYAIGELLGVFDGGKEALYWTLYAYYNPVTGEVTGMQIGWDGSLASGPMRKEKNGRIILDQILYKADGTLKALRHEEIMDPGGGRYASNVYERGADGEWALVRQWTWTRLE